MKILKKINLRPRSVFLKNHTTFQIGGFCSTFYEPKNLEELLPLWRLIQEERIPYYILGAGSNILASDEKIRLVIISLIHWQKIRIEDVFITCEAGVKINHVCRIALANGLSGFEFIYGLPATVGGALFMNARCFGNEISDLLVSAELLNAKGEIETYQMNHADFSYKLSPFQKKDCFILRATFSLINSHPSNIEALMRKSWQTRCIKGHFRAPSAGSYFKNDKCQLSAPSGLLVQEVGMKGYRVGGAQVAPWHANFLINDRGATTQDILLLAKQVKDKVKQEKGIELEEEVLFLK